MRRALISVSDKSGVVEFAKELSGMGWEIISTGGTARTVSDAGIPVTPVDQVTGFPEILDGRVKTLHPAIHGALLARRDVKTHADALAEHGIEPIDLVAVNLYPFRETVSRPGVTLEEAVEQIDIGGPSMLRSAAKNHPDVLVVVDPADYPRVIEGLKTDTVSSGLRKQLAAKVFQHTSSYDAAIADYLTEEVESLPKSLVLNLERVQALRYGENPAQRAALYTYGGGTGIANMIQHHGKELSFNNLLDVEGALLSIAPWKDETACVVIKHTTPCGIALGDTTVEAFVRARATDPTSAFGSVVAFNKVIGEQTAEAMSDLFVEVVLAPGYDGRAIAVFARKKNIRVVELPTAEADQSYDLRSIRGGVLAQDQFQYSSDESEWSVATRRQPTDREWSDLRFAWAAVAGVKSNAILLARDNAAIGIGAGQMSRVDSSFLAAHKARSEGHETKGCVLASDAFFPFADGIDEAATAGVQAIIQPGGSVRDAEVVEAANNHGIAMVMTGSRQFRH